MKGFWVFAGALLAAAGACAQLSETEQKIVAAAKQRTPAALELLERSVRINSGTLNPEGVRAVGEMYRAELESLGFKTRWVEMPADMKRAGHLVAEHAGTAGKRVLLMGHIDTVFEKSSSVPLWERRGDRVRGQGVNDMKGGDVAMIEALRAMNAAGALESANISIVFTGDEERVGSPIQAAREPVAELARRADYALSFEAAAVFKGQTYGVTARRSSGGWTLDVKGRPGHSSGIFSQSSGYGAVYEAARIVNAFREQLIEDGVTFNAGVIAGGTDAKYTPDNATATAFGKTNVIAREARVIGDLRVTTAEQLARMKERMRDIVAKSLPGTSATITFRDGYPPMAPSEAGTQLLQQYSKASEDAGLGTVVPRPPSMGGAGDIQFAAPYTTGIDGLGVTGLGAHTDDEDLEIASLERATIRAALFIHRLTRP